MTRHFVNVANGIECLPLLEVHDFEFVRIQSTALEQRLMDHVLRDLDANLIMRLALGERCVIWDAGRRRQLSRAQWQGLPWIKYALERSWSLPRPTPTVCGENVSRLFDQDYRSLRKQTRARLSYFRRWLIHDQELQLEAAMPVSSQLDGRYDELALRLAVDHARRQLVS